MRKAIEIVPTAFITLCVNCLSPSVLNMKRCILPTEVSLAGYFKNGSSFSIPLPPTQGNVFHQADEWIKLWYIYMMEYYPAIKKNEIMPCATV